MEFKTNPYRLHLFILLILFCCLFESCKQKEPVLQGKLELVASNGTGIVSFMNKSSKKELRVFPKQLVDSLEVDSNFQFTFILTKENNKEYVKLKKNSIKNELINSSNFNFSPDSSDPHSHNKYHTFRKHEFQDDTENPTGDGMYFFSSRTEIGASTITEIVACNNIIYNFINENILLDTLYFHFALDPYILTNSSGFPVEYKQVSTVTLDDNHPHIPY